MKLSNILIKPLITEKTIKLADAGKYVFEVKVSAADATVANEIKRIYNVDAINIHSMIMPGKKRRLAKTSRFTKTAQKKKVIVSLKEGQKLDLLPKE